MQKERCRRLIKQAIQTFHLDLTGYTVLTEAASNYYSLTPLIAAQANAKHVFAIAKDSTYGSAKSIKKNILHLAKEWKLSNRISIISRESKLVGEADIVTNLGFVRPIDRPFLNRLKPSVVIPLMWETWEFRKADLSLDECRKRQIPVLGTNENHRDLQIFNYVGVLVLKMVLEAQLEAFKSNLLIIGEGEFTKAARRTLTSVGAHVRELTVRDLHGRKEKVKKDLTWADAIIFLEHLDPSLLIGSRGLIKISDLSDANSNCRIVHLAGNADRKALSAAGFFCVPSTFAAPGTMSRTTDNLGPRPLIDLHSAGLKVGQELARNRRKGLKGMSCELAVLRQTNLAQGFKNRHDNKGAR